MKTPLFFRAVWFAAVAAVALPSSRGQGDLNPPPGPPAPTMKTLDQVEARTPVDAGHTPGDGTNLFIISAPGSYYLTGNIAGASGQHGIRIASDNVSLDLGGFTLTGGAGSLSGIIVPATANNVAIRRGTVRNWGQSGIDAAQARNGIFDSISASNNAATGIAIGYNCRMSACTALNNTSSGITAVGGCTITGCSMQGNGVGLFISTLDGGCDISDCTFFANTGVGASVFYGHSLKNCVARYNGGQGIVVSTGCTITGCTASYNYSNGIEAFSQNLITGNTVTNNGYLGPNGDGINCYGGNNRIDSNHATNNNGRGFRSTGGADIIIRNSSFSNSAGAYAPGTSSIGPIGSAGTATSPWANF
jgi:parallel beta-helix repeat protein